MLALPLLLLVLAVRAPVRPDARGPGLATARADRRGALSRVPRRGGGAHQRLGHSTAGGSAAPHVPRDGVRRRPRPPFLARSARGPAVAVAAGAAALFVLPALGPGRRSSGLRPQRGGGARGVDILTVLRVLPLSRARLVDGRRLPPARGAEWPRPIAAGLLLFIVAVLAAAGFFFPQRLLHRRYPALPVRGVRMAEVPEDRLACGLVATGFFLILFTAAVLHLRPDEHVLQALLRGLAPPRGRDGGPRVPPGVSAGDLRAMGRPLARRLLGSAGGRALHERHGRARGARRRPPPLRTGRPRAPRSTASPTGERAAPRRVPRRPWLRRNIRGHAGRPRGAGRLLPGVLAGSRC